DARAVQIDILNSQTLHRDAERDPRVRSSEKGEDVMVEFFSGATPAGHVAPEARVMTLLCGLVLCTWSLLKLRRRSLLVPTCTLFLAVGGAFILFALFPNLFDSLSYLVGIR